MLFESAVKLQHLLSALGIPRKMLHVFYLTLGSLRLRPEGRRTNPSRGAAPTVLMLLMSCSSDSHLAALPERREGHPAGGPLPGELLLPGGGAAQQARGGG